MFIVNICMKLSLFICIIHYVSKTQFKMCLTDALLSLRVKLDQEENKTPLDQWVPWYTSLFSSIIIRSLLVTIITFLVTSSLVSIQGIPGLRGEKGEPGRTGPKVKVKTQRTFHHLNQFHLPKFVALTFRMCFLLHGKHAVLKMRLHLHCLRIRSSS